MVRYIRLVITFLMVCFLLASDSRNMAKSPDTHYPTQTFREKDEFPGAIPYLAPPTSNIPIYVTMRPLFDPQNPPKPPKNALFLTTRKICGPGRAREGAQGEGYQGV